MVENERDQLVIPVERLAQILEMSLVAQPGSKLSHGGGNVDRLLASQYP